MEDRQRVIQKLNKAIDLASRRIGVTKDKIRKAIGYTKSSDSYSIKELLEMAIRTVQGIKYIKQVIGRK